MAINDDVTPPIKKARQSTAVSVIATSRNFTPAAAQRRKSGWPQE